MIRQNDAPTLSVQPQARIHSCRWAWCRLTFAINAELVHHVIHDHVRQTPPVMRKDIPMLKRAEEGIGESMSAFESSYSDATYPSHEDWWSSRPKPTIRVSAEAEPSSSLPSPPVSSPPSCPPTANGEAARSPEMPSSCPFRDTSQSLSPNIQQLSMNILARPDTPTTSTHQITQSRYATPTFASLSSPAAFPILSAVPGSPSFDSLVYEATSGKRKRTYQRSPRLQSPSSQFQNSQEFQNSFSSCGSQDAVERQLTQSIDHDDDDTEYTHPRAQITCPQTENDISSPEDEVGYKGESDWPAESSQMSSSHQQSSQTTSYQSLRPLQTQRHSPPAVSTGILNTPTGTSIPRQAWYGTLPSHPHKKRKSRQNSGAMLIGAHQTAAPATPTVSKPSVIQDVRPSGDTNSRPSGNVFQSGTLQITSPAQPVHGGSTDDVGSQSRSPIGWSQTQTQTSWSLHGSYPPLQTQAPYRSQSSSQ